jgi:hypothetical protein
MNAINSGEPLPPSLAARMIKYVIVKRKMKEASEKRAFAEVELLQLCNYVSLSIY